MRVIRRQLGEMVQTADGKVSNSKVWSFVGCAVATWIMIYLTLKDKMSVEIFFVYLCSVAGFSQLSKLLAYKYGSGAPTTTTTTTETPDTKTTETVVAAKCPDCPSPVKDKPAAGKEDEGQD